MTKFGYSFETFVCPEKVFFLVAKTRHYHVLSRHFSLSLGRLIMAVAPFPPLYQIRAPPDRQATSFECFFSFR